MEVLLCAIVKNENKYLDEWLKHYKSFGFSKCLLYDNNDKDGEEIHHSFGDFVEIVDYRGRHVSIEKRESMLNHGVQEEAYNDCYHNHADGYDWIAYFDIDEFMVIDGGKTINQFLALKKFAQVDAIQLNWRIYGDNDLVHYEDKPVRERFTTPAMRQTDHVKTIVRTNNSNFVSLHCHYAEIKNGKYAYPSGELTNKGFKQPIDYEGAHIDHYFTKTLEEWIDRKIGQTSATGKDYMNTIGRRLREFFTYNDKTPLKESLIREQFFIVVDDRKIQLPLIVSLTSYPERFKNLLDVIGSIYDNTCIPQKIVLNIFKGDEPYITEDMRKMQKHGLVEINICDVNMRPHLKYFPTMMKYKDVPIVTIDDDIIYSPDLLESLYVVYKRNPNCVIARRCHMIAYNNDGWDKYSTWKKDINDYVKSMDLCATGVGGVLYPPNILELKETDMEEAMLYLLTDDLYLKLVEYRKGISTICVPNNDTLGLLKLEKYGQRRLYDINVRNGNNDISIDMINKALQNTISQNLSIYDVQ